MRKLIASVVVLALLGAILWHARWPHQPTAIVLASIQSDTIDGLNGVDPIGPTLRDLGYRVYSLDLPCHYAGMTENGLRCWSERIAAGETDLLAAVCPQVSALIDEIGARRVQMVGVSRGGYVAYECGAQDDRVTEIAQIAPVVDLGALYEFDGVKLDPEKFSLVNYAPALRDKRNLIRIGRYDSRVSTAMSQTFGALIGAEVQLLDSDGHRAPDPDNAMAHWLLNQWNSLF